MAEKRSVADVALSGRYTIEAEIGRGGMATVCLAHDPRHHRQAEAESYRPPPRFRVMTKRVVRLEIPAPSSRSR